MDWARLPRPAGKNFRCAAVGTLAVLCRNGWHAQITAGGRRAAVCVQSPKGIALQPNNQAAHCDDVMGKTAPNCRT
jgi:hypothetical protein